MTLVRTSGLRRPAVPRLGLLDLLLVLLVVAAVGLRTPTGALVWAAAERLRGHDTPLPSLTAFFETGLAAPPTDVAPPPPGEVVALDALPEPFRTAARTTLASEVPAGIAERLTARGVPVTPESALAEIDAVWVARRDAASALEIALLGQDGFDRAVGRAAAGGEAEPERFESHRRYLSGAALRDADRFVGGTMALATALDLGWPIGVPHRITSPYGERMHPVLKERRFHDGVDLSVVVGTPVLAAQEAKVAVVGESAVAGKYVVLDHGHGVRTSYCHLSATPLPKGTRVAKGEAVAASGNTGRSTGPHLHYGVRIAGKAVDPERFRR